MFKRILIVFALLGGASMLHAQATPTASRRGDLQIGGGYTNANTDYVPNRVGGGTAYLTYDFKPHFGVEGDFRFIKDHTNYYEKSYEIGGRYYRTYKQKWVPYGRIMYGRGVFNFVDSNGVTTANLAYNLFSAGVGVDYKLRPYLNLRGDFHYQRWLGFPPNGLTPTMFTIGAAYHFGSGR